MAQIRKIKFNNIDYNLTARNGIFYIHGTGIIDDINNTSIWTGIHPDITEYFEGLTIAYKIGIEGSITTALNINDLGNIPVVKNTSEKISTDYSVGSVILLIYTIDDGVAYWKISDYNEDTKNTVGNYL